MTDFKTGMKTFVHYQELMDLALDAYYKERPGDDGGYWQGFRIENYKDGRILVEVYWERDSHCSCCSNDSGYEEIPLEDLVPYIETQWELDEFDRKLGKAEVI